MSGGNDWFWNNVAKADGCWEWRGSRLATGYGYVSYKGKSCGTHRVAWELTNGPIPDNDEYHGTCVLHHCDNPPCVRPDHLFLGTQADNMRDKAQKGRGGNLISKETRDAICERYAVGDVTFNDLAEQFSLSRTQAWRIVNGHAWNGVRWIGPKKPPTRKARDPRPAPGMCPSFLRDRRARIVVMCCFEEGHGGEEHAGQASNGAGRVWAKNGGSP